jgi:uncharacterized protein (DUF4415 family)
MAVYDRETPPALPPEFHQAADPAAPVIAPPKVMISMPLDADLVAYFQGNGEPSDWQRHINGVLRFYVETNQMREADAELVAQTGARTPEPSVTGL